MREGSDIAAAAVARLMRACNWDGTLMVWRGAAGGLGKTNNVKSGSK